MQQHPESSPFSLPAIRFASYVVDATLIYLFELMGSFLGGFLAALMTASDAPKKMAEDAAASGMVLGLFFWGFVAWFLNYGIVQGLTGGSIGKMVFGIRVVNKDGSAIGVMKSLGRSLCYVASAVPLYFGFLPIFWHQNRQAWHDSICGTVVIRKDVAYPAAAVKPAAAETPASTDFPNAA